MCQCGCAQGAAASVLLRGGLPGGRGRAQAGTLLSAWWCGAGAGACCCLGYGPTQLQSSSLLAVTLTLPGSHLNLKVSDSKVSPRIFSPLLASQDQT